MYWLTAGIFLLSCVFYGVEMARGTWVFRAGPRLIMKNISSIFTILDGSSFGRDFARDFLVSGPITLVAIYTIMVIVLVLKKDIHLMSIPITLEMIVLFYCVIVGHGNELKLVRTIELFAVLILIVLIIASKNKKAKVFPFVVYLIPGILKISACLYEHRHTIMDIKRNILDPFSLGPFKTLPIAIGYLLLGILIRQITIKNTTDDGI